MCFDTLAPPPPQPNSEGIQNNQIHRSKVEEFSAMDFQYFCGISIFSDYTGRLKKQPFLKGGEKMGKTTLFAAIKM